MGLIDVFTDNMHVHLQSFHQNLFLICAQTSDKFALFLENLSKFSLVCFCYPDSQRHVTLSFTTETEQDLIVLPPSAPNVLSLPFVCRKTLKNKFNLRSEKIHKQRK